MKLITSWVIAASFAATAVDDQTKAAKSTPQASPAQSAVPGVAADATDAAAAKAAAEFIELLDKGKFAEAVKTFDDVMTEKMPEEATKTLWENLLLAGGKLTGVEDAKITKYSGMRLADCLATFEKRRLKLRVVYNPAGKVTGLWFLPASPAAEFADAGYVDRSKFTEQEVKVGKEPYVLTGRFCVPAGAGPFPTLVLVHGSGPHDEDETIGPNKPFRDLRHGLASRGVAVLSYTKRTRAYGKKLKELKDDLTVETVTIDDAVDALKKVRGFAKVDADRVYMLGHSLGGAVAPAVTARDGKLAGMISLAGSTRPLEVIILEQVCYLADLDDIRDEAEKKRIAEIEGIVQTIKEGRVKDSDNLLGAPWRFWRSINEIDQQNLLGSIDARILILQGGRDYQVTKADFDNWQAWLADRSNATLNWYPKLNHLFIEGSGKPSPAEYNQPAHVSQVVIDDIAAWIRMGQTP